MLKVCSIRLLRALEGSCLPQRLILGSLSWVLVSSIGSLREGGLKVTANVIRNHSTCSSLCETCLKWWKKSEEEEKVASQSPFRIMPHLILYAGDT